MKSTATYKGIIKNMVECYGVREVEKMLQANDVIFDFIEVVSVEMTKDIDFGISFEIVADVVNGVWWNPTTIEINGYVDNYGGVNVCTIWKRTPDSIFSKGYKSDLVWSTAAEQSDTMENDWNLLK